MKIIPLSEGSFTIDKTKVFRPINLTQESLQDRPVGSLLVEIQPFLIETAQDLILLDTGLGYAAPDGQPQIHHNLRAAGYDPNSVTKVLMSHLHKDHAGGLFHANAQGERFLNFPYATHYVQKREFDFATGVGSASYVPQDFEALAGFSKLVWLEEDEGQIGTEVHYALTGAHSRFHQVFWIKSGQQTLFFGGDDAPQLQQMKSKFVAKYDYDGKKCMALRQAWWQEGTRLGWTFLFYHDISSPSFAAAGGS